MHRYRELFSGSSEGDKQMQIKTAVYLPFTSYACLVQLTSYTDYSLRTLLYLGARQERLVTISEISEFHGISRNHLVKAVHNLGKHGLIQTLRGKSGGIRLAKKPGEIVLADVVLLTEPHMNLQECFAPETNSCPLIDHCKLNGVLHQALRGFMQVLEGKTLADIL